MATALGRCWRGGEMKHVAVTDKAMDGGVGAGEARMLRRGILIAPI